MTFLILIIVSGFLYSQDTLRVMHYNLLYYGNSAFCSETTNNTDQKDAYLRTILSYTKPDIITVNEMTYQSTFHQRMLTMVMNQTGYALFDMVPGSNQANASIVNLLFYNTEKLGYHSKQTAQTLIRDIDVFRLYSLDVGMGGGDTIFLNCIVAHLKSSQGQSNEDDRADMVENTLNYLEENAPIGNYLFMGDFNFYTSSEEGFQMMINNNDPVFKFYDPVDEIGNWHNSSAFRQVHTQSTRTEQAGNCGASGGMDDRFDFIMMNKTIHDETDRIGYLDNSYVALGQDGQRLNGSISDPPNTSIPAYIVDALIGMSDHLPVMMDVVVDESLGLEDIRDPKFDIRYTNPVKDELKIFLPKYQTEPVTITLVSTTGAVIYRQQHNQGSITIPAAHLPTGMYILRITSDTGSFVGKVVIFN